ncbi:WD repeat-containing protein 61 [Spiromyces aspiralis]|uniref:WD repeat-containing protein 61 n=1 Tax=Spiromyces aspiralis TaxID=68401 RepID=A0ACC1HF52_9FUNG|nr:WD repeat-containing protein 61 [Spiromyces aspiralis]
MDGFRVITGSNDETIKIWDASSGEMTAQLADSTYAITSLDVSVDETMLLSTSMDNAINVWSLESSTLIKKIPAGAINAWTARFTKDGKKVVSGTDKGTIKLWSIESGRELETYDTTRPQFTLSVAISHDNTLLACGSDSGIVSVFNIESWRLKCTLMGEWTDGQEFAGRRAVLAAALPPTHSSAVRSLAFSPSSTLLISASDDGCIQAYDMSSGNNIMSLTGHKGPVYSVTPHPNSSLLVSGSQDKEVKLWDLKLKACVETYNTHSDSVWAVDWQPSGRPRLVSAGDDRMVQLYELLAFR